jgi:hypothetical protein
MIEPTHVEDGKLETIFLCDPECVPQEMSERL